MHLLGCREGPGLTLTPCVFHVEDLPCLGTHADASSDLLGQCLLLGQQILSL